MLITERILFESFLPTGLNDTWIIVNPHTHRVDVEIIKRVMLSPLDHRHQYSGAPGNMNALDSQAVKEEFDLHITHITDMNKSFVENSTKVAGFLLLGLGWFATSNDAREFLVSTPEIAMLTALAVASAYLLTVGASVVAFKFTRRAARRLGELAYLPRSAYEGRILSVHSFIFCLIGNGVLAVLLMVSLLSIAR